MTLLARDRIFKAGIIVAGIAFVFAISASIAAFPLYPSVAEESAFRSTGLVQGLFTGKVENSPYIPLITAVGAVLYSLVSIILIRYFFEKTQSEEIYYIGLFVLSLALECSRVMVPLKIALALPGIYLFMSSRLLIFGRCFGLFCLFIAGICASGLKVQKQRNIIVTAVTIALIAALGIPVDGLSWDSTLKMNSGYASMFRLVEAGLLAITVLSFFVAFYIRSSGEYISIGLGILMIFAGRDVFVNSDTWITPVPGFLVLVFGTWLVCTKLHRVYLWI